MSVLTTNKTNLKFNSAETADGEEEWHHSPYYKTLHHQNNFAADVLKVPFVRNVEFLSLIPTSSKTDALGLWDGSAARQLVQLLRQYIES